MIKGRVKLVTQFQNSLILKDGLTTLLKRRRRRHLTSKLLGGAHNTCLEFILFVEIKVKSTKQAHGGLLYLAYHSLILILCSLLEIHVHRVHRPCCSSCDGWKQIIYRVVLRKLRGVRCQQNLLMFPVVFDFKFLERRKPNVNIRIQAPNDTTTYHQISVQRTTQDKEKRRMNE